MIYFCQSLQTMAMGYAKPILAERYMRLESTNHNETIRYVYLEKPAPFLQAA